MNVKEYRKRYEAEMKRAASVAEARSPKHTKTLLAEKAEGSAERIAAIENTPVDATNLEEMVRQYLGTLCDKRESLGVRLAALDGLKAADFLGPRFDAYRADFLQSLRAISTDASSRLRERALETLAMHQDAYAQEVLLRGLLDAKAALVPAATAIQLLGYEGHGNAVNRVRELFDQVSETAKEEALRLLASDPASEPLFQRLLEDKSQKSMLRQLSAAGWQNVNNRAFEKAAQAIVTDEDDYDEIRATCLAALTAMRRPGAPGDDEEFARQLAKLKKRVRSANLRAALNRYLRLQHKQK